MTSEFVDNLHVILAKGTVSREQIVPLDFGDDSVYVSHERKSHDDISLYVDDFFYSTYKCDFDREWNIPVYKVICPNCDLSIYNQERELFSLSENWKRDFDISLISRTDNEETVAINGKTYHIKALEYDYTGYFDMTLKMEVSNGTKTCLLDYLSRNMTKEMCNENYRDYMVIDMDEVVDYEISNLEEFDACIRDADF